MEIIENHGGNLGKIRPTLCKITVLYIEKGQLESAIKCYTTAPEKNPNLSEAGESLGDMSLNLNRNEDAQIFFFSSPGD